jgi:hypothetical protein
VGEYHFDPECCRWDEDGNPEGCDGPPREEPEPPDCGRCHDGQLVPARLGADRGRWRRCPACNPTRLQRAVRALSPLRLYRAWQWRRRGASTDEPPF